MKTEFTNNGLIIKPDKIIKKRFYIGDGSYNSKRCANQGYVQRVLNKKEKKELKKKGYLFFETFERAQNYRLAEILGG
jgi:hypothetical protein